MQESLAIQEKLFPEHINYKMWKYAILVTDTSGNFYVKDGDTRCATKQEAIEYAASQTTGKIRGLMRDKDVLGVWDMTAHAITIGKDPKDGVDACRGYDNDIRGAMPLRRKLITNFCGQNSLELHPVPNSYIELHGPNWKDVLALQWHDAHNNLLDATNEVEKCKYDARPYLEELFQKINTNPMLEKFLLAGATGSGKETSTLATIIHVHDIKKYNSTKIHCATATIPSTTSELFNELGTVSGMTVCGQFVDFSRIIPYVTKQWLTGYLKDCSPRAKLYIQNTVTVVEKVSDIPKHHATGEVPILFGGFHDLALKSVPGSINKRYKGLNKRIGVLAIGEAHQMLSNADNKMWTNLNSVFGEKCFKLFITGTPYDFIYGNSAAEFFGIGQRSLFTRNDLYRDKRLNPNSPYKNYPDFNFYGISNREIIEQLKLDPKWKGDAHGFTYKKLFTYSPKKGFKYEQTIVWLFKRMFSPTAFDEAGEPISVFNASGLCDVAKQHGMVALPTGTNKAPAKVIIPALKRLLIKHNAFPGEIFDAYDDDLGDRKDDIANAPEKTLTLTCNKDCTGANIPELGYFVFMRKLGDSIKFFEQATGRIGRQFKGKTNCGVFLADLENSMNVMLTIEENINAERGEDFSVRELIEELLENYNYFLDKNGRWESIDPVDFAATLEKLNARGNYGINRTLRNTAPAADFDLFFDNTVIRETEKIDINSNGNKGAKNANRKKVIEQLGLPFNDKRSAEQNWINAKLAFVAKTRMLAFLKGAKTVAECVSIIENAILTDDKTTLAIVGKGAEWFPTLMTDDHIDVIYTNRWIQKLHDNVDTLEDYLGMFEGSEHRTDYNFIAEPNRFLRKMISSVLNKKRTKDLTFFDPCGGRGGFLIYILKLGGTDIDPSNVYYNDIDPTMVALFREANKKYALGIPAENITCGDFLKWKTEMKFDVIVGNPPYQGPSKPHNIWSTFSLTAISLLKKNGYIAFITPESWMSPNSELFQVMKQKQLLLVDTNISQYFPTVGSSFSSWILQNAPHTTKTKINNTFVDILPLPYLIVNPIELSIHNKVLFNDGPKLNPKFDTTSAHSANVTKKPNLVSKTQSKSHRYKIFHTNPQLLWSSIKPKHYDKLKVIFTTSGYLEPFYDDGRFGTSEASAFIEVKNAEEGETVVRFLQSPLIQLIVKTGKWSGFLNAKVLQLLPSAVNFVTNAELYNYFSLTKEEIEYIESTIK